MKRAGYTCSSESNSQKTPAVYEDWLHALSQYSTDLSHSIPACMTVTRELNTSFSALRTRARSHPERPRSSFSLHCLFSRCLCVQADIITCLSNSCFHSQNEFRTNSDHFLGQIKNRDQQVRSKAFFLQWAAYFWGCPGLFWSNLSWAYRRTQLTHTCTCTINTKSHS